MLQTPTVNSPTRLHTVLLIDDDQVTSYIHHLTLKEAEACSSIEVKYNGEEAFNFIKSFYSHPLCCCNPFKKMPQLIFVDIHMPVLDGFGFLRKLNAFYAQRGEKRQMKIVMLSSSVNPKDIKLAEELGCDGYLEKPLTSDKIHHLIGTYFEK